MPGPGERRGGYNGSNPRKTDEELLFAENIRKAMMQEAMRKEAANTAMAAPSATNAGMMNPVTEGELTLGGPASLTQAEDPWNLRGTRESTKNEGGLFSGLSNWETATLLDSQGLLGNTPFNPNEVEGSGGPRGGGANRTDRYNSYQLNNYNGPAFETTDDIYSYINGLNLNTDRRTFKGGRGGIMETADTSGQNQLKTDANTFINQQNFKVTGQQPVYEKDGKIYVLNTGHGSNLPELDGPIPFSGSGGMYHEASGSPQGNGDRTKQAQTLICCLTKLCLLSNKLQSVR